MWNTKRLAFAIAVAAIAIASTLTFAHGAASISAAKPPRPTGGVLALKTGPAPTQASKPAPSASPTPAAASGDSTAAADSTTSGTTTSGSRSGGTSTPRTPDCTTVSRNAVYQLGQVTYRQGDVVTGATSITNHGATCSLSNATVSFVVKDGGTTVTQQSLQATTSSTWASGSTLTVNLSFATKDCSVTPCSAQPPGAYSALVTWPGLAALNQNFTLVAATTCDASAFKLALAASPAAAAAGTTLSFNGTLTNTSSQTCAVSDSTSLVIRNAAGHSVFGAGLGNANNNQLLAPGQSLTYPFAWNQECGTTSCPRGSYTATLTDTTYSMAVGPLNFTLI